MKLFLLSLMISGASQWLMGNIAKCDDGDSAKKRVVVMKKGDAATGDAKVFVVGKGQGQGVATFTIDTDDDDDGQAADGKKRTVVIKKLGDDGESGDGRSEDAEVVVVRGDDDEESGWLGVSVAEVPEALAAQLEIEGSGVLVQNVVEGSPADKAGLQVHDVIVSLGGQVVEGDVGQLVKLVQSRKPGDVVELALLRDGNKKKVQVTFGTRAGLENAMEWKFQVAPDAEVEDEVHTHGRMLRKDDKGNWVMEDLGDLKELKNLPDNIKMYLPKSGSKSVQVFTEGANKKIRTKVQKDGNVIIVEQDGDGEIQVTRVNDQGVENKASYADGEALRDADEEAYELYEDSSKSTKAFSWSGGHGAAQADGDGPHWSFDFDADDLKGHFGDWQVHMEKSLEAAKEAHEKAMAELHELMQQWKDGDGFKVDPGQLRFFGHGDPGGLAKIEGLGLLGKPKHSFELQSDGSIEVRIRRGDSELVRKYADEDDLAKRDPKLYDKYQKLRDAEEDE